MKVIRKSSCCEKIDKPVCSIRTGTVFSGRLITGPRILLLRGPSNHIILLEDAGGYVSGTTWNDQLMIYDYKEENATICIED